MSLNRDRGFISRLFFELIARQHALPLAVLQLVFDHLVDLLYFSLHFLELEFAQHAVLRVHFEMGVLIEQIFEGVFLLGLEELLGRAVVSDLGLDLLLPRDFLLLFLPGQIQALLLVQKVEGFFLL